MQKKHNVLIGVACALVILAAGAAGWFYWLTAGSDQQQRGTVATQKEALHVFFPLSKTKLGRRVLEVRAEAPDRERADLILKELKKERAVSPGVQVRDLAIGIDSTLYLNLSRNFTEKQSNGPPEIVMVYALVNSFVTSFRDVRKVQFLVEGEAPFTVGGLVYAYQPLEFNKDLMED